LPGGPTDQFCRWDFPVLAQPRVDVDLVGKLGQPADIPLTRGRQEIALPALSALIGGKQEEHRHGGKDKHCHDNRQPGCSSGARSTPARSDTTRNLNPDNPALEVRLPPLYEPVLTGIAPLSVRLGGIERMERGVSSDGLVQDLHCERP
jgi:hypothetical protein